jgi:hypothetical protein
MLVSTSLFFLKGPFCFTDVWKFSRRCNAVWDCAVFLGAIAGEQLIEFVDGFLASAQIMNSSCPKSMLSATVPC